MEILQDYVALDIETTGLRPKYDKIIEIGAVRVRDGKAQETFSTFVDPARSLSPKIVELTGIRDEDVAGAPYIEGVIDSLIAFAGDDILLGHNLIFDYSFVKKAAVDRKKRFDREGIDTLYIARKFLKDLESRNLGFLCGHYQISLDAHRALNDATAAHELYQILVREFAGRDPEAFMPRPLRYEPKKEGPVTPKQLAMLQRLIARYGLACSGMMLAPVQDVTQEHINIEKMTKNEASRIIDKLLVKFGR